MSEVLIEGTPTHSVYLKNGARTRVERTDLIDTLIRKGFVKVIEEYPDAAPAVEPEPEQAVDPQPVDEPVQEATAPAPVKTAPRRPARPRRV